MDPYTREPLVELDELDEIVELLGSAGRLVFQNSKFDMQMIDALFRDYGVVFDWDWSKIHEVGISSHLLASSQAKDLTTLAMVYCGLNLEPFEARVHAAVSKAHRIIKSKKFIEEVGKWRWAQDDMPEAPSGANWKTDMWILRALLTHAPDWLPPWEQWLPGEHDPEEHPWGVLCEEYANADPAATLAVFKEQQRLLERGNLVTLYERRRLLLPIVYDIEETGITVSRERTQELQDRFGKIVEERNETCLTLAGGKLKKLPLGGRSNALNDFVFNDLGLVSPKKTKSGAAAMDKEVLAGWLTELPEESVASQFLRNLQEYRKYMTAIGFMNAYERFGTDTDWNNFLLLHPTLNMVGTSTLRWSSSNPNEQNVSKKEGSNLRYTFGPPPGYVWATLDYENLELRIPSYESGEDLLIDLFENPDRPPFYGSSHLLNFSTVYPEIWDPLLKELGAEHVAEYVKTKLKSTWYGRVKAGGFAIQYGAVEIVGKVSTADRAFGKEGGHRALKERFSKQEKLNQYWINHALETGYVETIPDRVVCPSRGYPLQCKRTKWGKIKETIPLNYHVQGTACWVIGEAMLLVHDFFQEINRGKPPHKHWKIILQVHDELGIQFPRGPGCKPILREVKRLMESCGEPRIGVPLRVGCDLHDNNWSQGKGLKL